MIITNKNHIKEASAILDKKTVNSFFESIGVKKIVVLPSSIHETIIIPAFDGIDIEQFNAMVCEVNKLEVAPGEQLSDRAYLMDIVPTYKAVG